MFRLAQAFALRCDEPSTKSEKIRALSGAGFGRTEIAKYLGITYQHVYNVLAKLPKASDSKEAGSKSGSNSTKRKAHVELTSAHLCAAGFEAAAKWVLDDKGIKLDRAVPSGQAVYAFAVAGIVKYVGVAKLDIKRRLYGYKVPGPTQKTNVRVRPLIRTALEQGSEVEILVAKPLGGEWNGLPIDQVAGLEAGLIRRFAPPWNVQGTGLQYATVDDL